ncbi:nucleotide-diphospho-sugar transferase superfamily protein, partial [Striga asiatica]
VDDNAKGMRFKAWAYFKNWMKIFGKDRATGENAEIFAEMARDILNGEDGLSDSPTREPMHVDRARSNLASHIGFEQDTMKARKAIDEATKKMSFLTMQDKIAVGARLCEMTKELNYLFNFIEADKAMMMQMILEEKL